MIACELDISVPLPSGTEPNFFDLRKRAAAACKAAKYLGVKPPKDLDKVDKEKGVSMLLNTAEGRPPTATDQRVYLANPNNAHYIDALLNAYDMDVVKSAKQLRTYVTNRLVLETDNSDPRIRMKALELLGKVTEVGLFTERVEATINNKSNTELEETLKSKLIRLLNKNSENDVIDLVPKPVRVVNTETEYAELEAIKSKIQYTKTPEPNFD